MSTLYEYWQALGSDFATGVALLPRNSGMIPRIFAQLQAIAANGTEPTPYLREKLEYALSKLPAPEGSEEYLLPALSNPDTGQHDIIMAALEIKPEQDYTGDDAGLDRDHPLWPQVVDLHKEHSHYHALMVAATDNPQRAGYAGKIINEILPEIDRLCDIIRSGYAVEVAPSVSNSLRKLLTLRSRVSRLHRLIEEADSTEKRKKYEDELEEKKTQIEALEALDV